MVGSRVFCCSCIFVSLRACYPVPISLVWGADTAVHTWVGVEFRVVGQHVAVNIKNPSRSWVHNRACSKSRLFFSGLVFFKLDWVAFGVLYWVMWPEPRCWDSQNNLGRLVSWKTLWNGFFGVSFVCHSGPGPLFALQPCGPDLSQNCPNVISLRKNRMVDDKKDQRQKPRKWSSGARRVRSGGRRDSGWRNRGRGSVRKSSSSSSSSYSQSRRKRRGRQQNVNEAQKLLEKHDPQHQQWKEEAKKKERAVELQEQTMCALSPSLITPPQFPPSPPGVPSLALVLKREEDQTICWEHRSFDGWKRNCCTRLPLVGTGTPKMSSSKFMGSIRGLPFCGGAG